MLVLPLNPAGWRRLPDMRQAEAAECGLVCLAMVAGYHGHGVDLNTLRRKHPVSLKGTTLKTLMATADQLRLVTRPLRLEPDQLAALKLPAILHWDMTHFVVMKRVRRGSVDVHDPALGERRYTMAEVAKRFTGVALELTPAPDFKRANETRRLRLWDLVGWGPGLLSAAIQTLALSLVLQLYVLASPFFIQLAVDDAIGKNDADFLVVLALGFGLFLLINAGAGLLRSYVLLYVQSGLCYGMGAGIFRHLVQLPLAYFEKRHVGDLASRFTSVEPIREMLGEGLVSALVDGAMATLTGVMIVIYGPSLALVVFAALGVYLGLRLALYRVLRRRSLDVIQAKARESSTFIETIRAIQCIKIFCREAERTGTWTNRYAETINTDTAVARLKATFKTLNDLTFGVENIAVVYLGANAVLGGHMTVGMLFAFLAYKQQFVDKASRLAEKAIEFRMLDLHLERLSDISATKPEAAPERPDAYRREIEGSIEVRNLSFRYAEGEPLVLDRVSFSVDAGEYVAVTGPSGGGKTTLMKVLLGLLPPTSGEVLIDGLPLAIVGTRSFRSQIGVVMQDDQLLSGSIADNICFFDDRFEVEWMQRCAALAGIHDEIMRMPMAYNTLIGDMGSSLSGGQKQRILLARALYRRPRMLFVDEGTSHLDVATEAKVNHAIEALGLTRIVIAHRPETVASAGRRLVVAERGVREAPALALVS